MCKPLTRNMMKIILLSFTFFCLGYGGEYRNRFLIQYGKIIDPVNQYFSKEGVPYHSAETLLIESTDYGHETDSEAFSYNVFLKAVYGGITGEFKPFNDAWDMIDNYMIPTLQPNTDRYDPINPVTISGMTVGQDPLFAELKEAYNTDEVYIMHWMSDVDNVYGFGNSQGNCELGPKADGPSFVNLGQGSLWQGFNTPTCDNFTYGGKYGFQFTNERASRSYNYNAGPDADARAVQAAFWASQWAKEQGKITSINETLSKAAKMGDFLRYTFFDQYYKQIGHCVGKVECPGSVDKNSSHYLISWGISWGGSLADKGYSWRTGNSVCYYGYQNLVTAHGLINESTMRPQAKTAVDDWKVSLERQLELYEYLQTSNGAFAAGITNSWNKSYADPPEDYKSHSFYGMWFDYQPGYADANPWFGFQAWTADRVAQYYYLTGNDKARRITEKWVSWVISEIKFDEDGDFTLPGNIRWDGLPPETVVAVTAYGQSIGSASATARTISYYSAASGNETTKIIAKKLLDALWNHHQTNRGISNIETFSIYSNLNNKLYIPLENWTGVYPNGDMINENSTFLSVRSWFKNDQNFSMIEDYLNGGAVPQFEVHRFWEQADVAIAFGVYAMLFDE